VISRHLGVAAILAVSLLRSVEARAEQPPLTLEWAAPEGCPRRADVLARVLELIQSKESRAVVRGVVTRSGDRALLRLETSVTRAPRSGDAAASDALSGTRELAGATCEEVTAAGVLVIALAIDPDAAERGASGAPPPEPTSALETPAAEAGPSGSVPPPVAVEQPPSETPGVAPPAEPRVARAFAMGSALLDVGTLPGPSLGFRAGAGLSLERARVELGASYLLPRFAPADGSSAGAHVSLFTGNLRGCYLVLPARIGVEGCLGAEVGALIADGEGFERTATDVTPWVAMEASTGLAFAITPDLSLGASVGALVPFGRSIVGFTRTTEDTRTYTELHQPSAVSLRLGLGLSLLFR
jgi:hypothetical protein